MTDTKRLNDERGLQAGGLFSLEDYQAIAKNHGLGLVGVSIIGNAFSKHVSRQGSRDRLEFVQAVDELAPLLRLFEAEQVASAIEHAALHGMAFSEVAREARHNLSRGKAFLSRTEPMRFGAYSVVPAPHPHPEALWGYEVKNVNGDTIATVGFNFGLHCLRLENIQGVAGKSADLSGFSEALGGRQWECFLASIAARHSAGEPVFGIRGDCHPQRYAAGDDRMKRYDKTWAALKFGETGGRDGYLVATAASERIMKRFLRVVPR